MEESEGLNKYSISAKVCICSLVNKNLLVTHFSILYIHMIQGIESRRLVYRSL